MATLSQAPHCDYNLPASVKDVLHSDGASGRGGIGGRAVALLTQRAFKMVGSSVLKRPMILNDGRRLTFLGDAAELVAGLSDRRKSRDHWRHMDQLLEKARRPMATESALDAFVSQLTFALASDGLL